MAYDLLITNGTIVDGNGGPRFNADVAVQSGSIAALETGADFRSGVWGAVILSFLQAFRPPQFAPPLS